MEKDCYIDVCNKTLQSNLVSEQYNTDHSYRYVPDIVSYNKSISLTSLYQVRAELTFLGKLAR